MGGTVGFVISVAEKLNMEILALKELQKFEAERRTKSLKIELLQSILITSVAGSLVQLWPGHLY